jgi:hypothetical protein
MLKEIVSKFKYKAFILELNSESVDLRTRMTKLQKFLESLNMLNEKEIYLIKNSIKNSKLKSFFDFRLKKERLSHG